MSVIAGPLPTRGRRECPVQFPVSQKIPARIPGCVPPFSDMVSAHRNSLDQGCRHVHRALVGRRAGSAAERQGPAARVGRARTARKTATPAGILAALWRTPLRRGIVSLKRAGPVYREAAAGPGRDAMGAACLERERVLCRPVFAVWSVRVLPPASPEARGRLPRHGTGRARKRGARSLRDPAAASKRHLRSAYSCQPPRLDSSSW
jgi:hypothetical protein